MPNNEETKCKIKHIYYARVDKKRVVSLVTVTCDFKGAYVKPPDVIIPPLPNGWTDDIGAKWLDENNIQWEA